jgi:threonine dehydrogenase-like Zn-dependent dehydrogenase
METAIPQVLSGQIDPGRVFDRTVALADIADAYRAMNDREAIKVMVTPA